MTEVTRDQTETTVGTMVSTINTMFIHAGMDPDKLRTFQSDPYVLAAQTLDWKQQRIYLNRYFGLQLSRHSVDTGDNTINERFSLIETGTQEDWLRIFEKTLLPYFLLKDLPSAVLLA